MRTYPHDLDELHEVLLPLLGVLLGQNASSAPVRQRQDSVSTAAGGDGAAIAQWVVCWARCRA